MRAVDRTLGVEQRFERLEVRPHPTRGHPGLVDTLRIRAHSRRGELELKGFGPETASWLTTLGMLAEFAGDKISLTALEPMRDAPVLVETSFEAQYIKEFLIQYRATVDIPAALTPTPATSIDIETTVTNPPSFDVNITQSVP